jgi:hypothetical protein
LGTAGLETVELLRGSVPIYSHPLAEPGQSERPLLKLVWEGAKRKWRDRPTIWHGSLSLQHGRIVSAEAFAFDSPDQGIVTQTENRISWCSSTAGDPDGLFLDIDAPADAVLSFKTEPASFSFTLGDLDRGPMVVDAGGLEQRVSAMLVPRGPRPRAARFAYRDEAAVQGTNAYWLRVIQRDGAMAWSSPVFVQFG